MSNPQHYIFSDIIFSTIGAKIATSTAGRIKKIIGIRILVAAVAPSCSALDDLFTRNSFDNCFNIGPMDAPTESAAIKVAQNELISIMLTRQLIRSEEHTSELQS